MVVQPEDFDHYKRMYIKVFKYYELYINGDDLFDI